MYNMVNTKLLTLEVAAPSLSTGSSKDFSSQASQANVNVSSSSSLRALAHNFANMRIPGRLAAVKSNAQSPRRKYPASMIQNDSRNGKALDSCTVEGSTFLRRDVGSLARLAAPDNNIPEKDTCGRHFLFDKKWKSDRMSDFREERSLRPGGCIPPLPRDYQVHRSGNLQRYSPRKELSHGPAWPLTLGTYEGYSLTLGPAILIPSAISLNGRLPFSTDSYKHRPRVNNRAGNLFTIGAQQKSQTYPDPVSGGPASFVQRLSEISSLEGETVRQEKIKKLKKSKKQEY